MTIHAATGKFVFDADLDLLVNPKEEDIKFIDKVDQFFVALGRVAYELPLYKIYKNNLYHFYMDAQNVSTIFLISNVSCFSDIYIIICRGPMNMEASMPTSYRRSWREGRAVVVTSPCV